MSALSNPADRLSELAGAVCNNEASRHDLLELDALLAVDPAARQRYMEYCRVHAALRLELRANRAAQNVRRRIDGDSASLPYGIVHHTPQNTTGYSLHSWPLAYLVATVLFAVGIFIGSFIHISRSHLDNNDPRQNLVGQTQESHSVVGRITALADCQWHKEGSGFRGQGAVQQVASHPPSALRPTPSDKTVYLGDRLVLSTGLMEITYDTGAKVILQGPCTYEIDSARSGYLAVGKLTARIEKGAGVRSPGSGNTNLQISKATNHKSPSPLSPLPSPLFAVRTPTAVVTDLGTEFGVEVEESGATRSHVFQGSVEVRSSNSRRLTTSGESVEILQAGQSARVERGRNSIVVITRESGQLGRFVRRIPSSLIPHPSSLAKSPPSPAPRPASSTRMSPEAYAEYVLSLDPVAYYRMERPKAEEERFVVHDSAPGKHHGVFWSRDRSDVPYAPGRFGDAMSFRGTQMGDCVMVRGVPKPKHKPFTVATWIMLADRRSDYCLAFAQWGFSNSGERRGNVPKCFRLGVDNSDDPACLLPNRWHHVASVVSEESGKTTMRTYENGKLIYLTPRGNAALDLPEIFWNIGGLDPSLAANVDFICGWIDEFAIFHKALSPETIERLYRGGMPAAKGGHQ